MSGLSDNIGLLFGLTIDLIAPLCHYYGRITPVDSKLMSVANYLRGGGGGYLGQSLLGMCHWPLRAPSPL